jgi:hypothetical protein
MPGQLHWLSRRALGDTWIALDVIVLTIRKRMVVLAFKIGNCWRKPVRQYMILVYIVRS